jgi:CheY-like chemotaxis protein
MNLVLLVDDEPQMAGLVAMALDSPDARVHLAKSLTEALEAARSERPDVVLLDLALGEEDGLEILPDLKREPALDGVPIVAFTVHGSRRREALRKGVDGFVAKPFRVASLRDALHRLSDASGH